VAVAVEDVRAFRWLVVTPPVPAVFRCHAEGDRVAVQIEGYAEATVVFADRYAAPPPPDTAPVAGPPPTTAERLYADRWMFHGPRYQGVVEMAAMGKDSIRGTLETGAAIGALLDNAGQLFGLHIMVTHDVDRMAMPVSIKRLRFFAPH